MSKQQQLLKALFYTGKGAGRKAKEGSTTEFQLGNIFTMSSSPSENRLVSLDVFRGGTIAVMMMVNNPGDWASAYGPLRHSTWNGWTFTDMVFPFFVWIVGVAIPLSITRRLAAGATRRELFQHAARRALIIFALGFFLNCFGYLVNGSLFRDGFSAWLHNFLTTVRIPGVLQRIAICYFAAVAIYLWTGLRGRVVALLTLLIGYWLVMTLVPVPGVGAGVLERECNLSQYIDNVVLNNPAIGTHVYQSSKVFDPEGILSTLPAVATCLFGVLAGMLLQGSLAREQKAGWIFTGGAVLLWLGQLFDMVFPINKNIWTSSYSVFMAGMAMLIFGCCYWLADCQGLRRWAKPFTIYGMNAITMFVLSGMLGRLLVEIKISGTPAKTWLYAHSFGQIPDPKLGSLGWAVMYMLLLYAVAWGMYRRKWFIKF